MNLSNYLAEVWGISIIILTLAMLIRPNYIKKLFTEVENETTMFFWGFISLIIGITMVLAHNVWVKDWRVIITVLGWLSLLKGLHLLFLPEMTKKCVKKIENSQFIPFVILAGVFVGLILTYLGFTA